MSHQPGTRVVVLLGSLRAASLNRSSTLGGAS